MSVRNDDSGKRVVVPMFPPRDICDNAKIWEVIDLLYSGGEYARSLNEGRLKVLASSIVTLTNGGDPFAKNFLGVLCYRGDMGIVENKSLAEELFREAALSSGRRVPVAWFNLGILLWRKSQHHDAIDAFIAGSQHGCSFCKSRLRS